MSWVHKTRMSYLFRGDDITNALHRGRCFSSFGKVRTGSMTNTTSIQSDLLFFQLLPYPPRDVSS
ncbi:MAG: hypothetical protein ACJATE_002438 [Bacteroidia bacterium]|jgi:hypothetical protein